MKPPTANAISFARAGDTVMADGGQLVLAHPDDHAADAGALEVRRRAPARRRA